MVALAIGQPRKEPGQEWHLQRPKHFIGSPVSASYLRISSRNDMVKYLLESIRTNLLPDCGAVNGFSPLTLKLDVLVWCLNNTYTRSHSEVRPSQFGGVPTPCYSLALQGRLPLPCDTITSSGDRSIIVWICCICLGSISADDSTTQVLPKIKKVACCTIGICC